MFGQRPNDNAWTQLDRRERRKTVLTVIAFLFLALAGGVLLVWALSGHGAPVG